MLSDEKIVEIYKQSQHKLGGSPLVTVFDNEFYARSIEREANAPLLEQIKENEALMHEVLTMITAHPYVRWHCAAAAEALRKRLEARK